MLSKSDGLSADNPTQLYVRTYFQNLFCLEWFNMPSFLPSFLKPAEIIKILTLRTGALKFPHDMEPECHDSMRRVAPYTMTSVERLYSLYQSVRYIVGNKIPGDIVECGVWKGGSMMLVALELQKRLDLRQLHMFDTFAGMTAPSEHDVDFQGERAGALLSRQSKQSSHVWAYSPLEEVRAAMTTTGYPSEMIQYVQGDVCQTLPESAPEQIALLRLDTDWYASTYHELQHLYDRLVPGGVLIIDDYGYWRGARQACDQFFQERGLVPLLTRIDSTGRLLIK